MKNEKLFLTSVNVYENVALVHIHELAGVPLCHPRVRSRGVARLCVFSFI